MNQVPVVTIHTNTIQVPRDELILKELRMKLQSRLFDVKVKDVVFSSRYEDYKIFFTYGDRCLAWVKVLENGEIEINFYDQCLTSLRFVQKTAINGMLAALIFAALSLKEV